MKQLTTTTMVRTVLDPAIEELERELGGMELEVMQYTLADAIREGCGVTEQLNGGWVESGKACALSAAYVAAKARGYVK